VKVGSVSAGVGADFTFGVGLVSQTTLGASYYYDFDALGSTADLTNAAGAVVNSYAYDPFGSSLASSTTVSNPSPSSETTAFPSKRRRFYMQYRSYSAALGQFLSNDPLGLLGGDSNVRRYVNNDPADLIDPLGLEYGYGAFNGLEDFEGFPKVDPFGPELPYETGPGTLFPTLPPKPAPTPQPPPPGGVPGGPPIRPPIGPTIRPPSVQPSAHPSVQSMIGRMVHPSVRSSLHPTRLP